MLSTSCSADSNVPRKRMQIACNALANNVLSHTHNSSHNSKQILTEQQANDTTTQTQPLPLRPKHAHRCCCDAAVHFLHSILAKSHPLTHPTCGYQVCLRSHGARAAHLDASNHRCPEVSRFSTGQQLHHEEITQSKQDSATAAAAVATDAAATVTVAAATVATAAVATAAVAVVTASVAGVAAAVATVSSVSRRG